MQFATEDEIEDVILMGVTWKWEVTQAPQMGIKGRGTQTEHIAGWRTRDDVSKMLDEQID